MMAVSYYSPYVGDNIRAIPEAVEVLAESGHPISRSTLERLCRRNGVPLVKYGRTNHADWTALAKLHRDWVNARR
jgi:hypothetical protein